MAYWFLAIASGPEWFSNAQTFLGSILGRVILFGFTISLIFHFLNGIRHLFWDAGIGFELRASRISGWLVVIGTLLITIIIWVVGYILRGDL